MALETFAITLEGIELVRILYSVCIMYFLSLLIQ